MMILLRKKKWSRRKPAPDTIIKKGLSQKENEAAPKKTMAGTMKVSAKGVLLWCETKQNAGRLYSIRDWISTMPASFHRNNYPEGRPGEITQRNHRKDEFGSVVCDLLPAWENRV